MGKYYYVGSGIASLAGAAYLIRNGNVTGSDIRFQAIVERAKACSASVPFAGPAADSGRCADPYSVVPVRKGKPHRSSSTGVKYAEASGLRAQLRCDLAREQGSVHRLTFLKSLEFRGLLHVADEPKTDAAASLARLEKTRRPGEDRHGRQPDTSYMSANRRLTTG